MSAKRNNLLDLQDFVSGASRGSLIDRRLRGRGGTKDRRKWDEFRKKWLLWLYYHSPILLLGFSYDAYMMRI